MAGLIVKSHNLKCGEDHSVSGYLHYIGTRERVELLPDDRPPTRKQEQFITKLVKYFPNVKELNEFSGYETKPTKANASSLITRALEENWSALQKTEGYMKYIATRPRAERLGGMVCLVMRTAWTWQRPWKNWTTTLERYGRTSSP